jgi:preprotein translocase subunit SecY
LFKKILNVFRIADLRIKLLFTVAMLCVYRIGFYVPLPGVNAPAIREEIERTGGDQGAWGMLSNYLSVFSGGDLQQGTLFGLGIMPYISASIILQLLGTVTPALEKLKKEGEPGVRKINEWTRYITVGVCLFQAMLYMVHFNAAGAQKNLFTLAKSGEMYHFLFLVLGVVLLTAGSVFLMWLGEQIEAYGIGNGISLIITAGIVARMPAALQDVLAGVLTPGTKKLQGMDFVFGFFRDLFSFHQPGQMISLPYVILLLVCFVFVVGAAIYLTQAQRRIVVQQAKHMRGRRVYGGAKQYLPLRVNHAGVMPIIFASTLVQLPLTGIRALAEGATTQNWWNIALGTIARTLEPGGYMYELTFCVMIIFFSYFWNTVQFQPKEMANQLRDYGSFVMGIRPGKWTADYLEAVMERITYVGAGFLCVIAIIPNVVTQYLLKEMPSTQAWQIAQFLGGTGLLIVISVMLDFVNRIEANLVMRNYSGFLDEEGGGGPSNKIKRPKGSSEPPQIRTGAYEGGSDNPRGITT